MLVALYLFVDDDYDNPVYADPDVTDLEPELYTDICETANEAFEGDRAASGTHTDVDEMRLGWKFHSRLGLNLVCVVSDDVEASDLESYIKDLMKQYLDEVDDPRDPEREGVYDVIVDVIPPWED